jgi:hypothetical protein
LQFHLSGIQKVSQDYINQFFTVGQIQMLINDAQQGKLTDNEQKLLCYLGLGPMLKTLEVKPLDQSILEDEIKSLSGNSK